MPISYKRVYKTLSSHGVIVNDNTGAVCYPDIGMSADDLWLTDYEGEEDTIVLTDKFVYEIKDGSILCDTGKDTISLTVMAPKKLRG
jgi:hypothetical protein